MKKKITKISTFIISALLSLFIFKYQPVSPVVTETYSTGSDQSETFSLDSVPAYSQKAYAVINNNIPYFTEADYTTESYEYYSNLDSLGRCGVCIASIGRDLMPSDERGPIGKVRPSGWHTIKYDNIDGNYLYNRCHLIGYQLTGENANTANLITGTRYLNVQGMLPFEDMTADYIKKQAIMYFTEPRRYLTVTTWLPTAYFLKGILLRITAPAYVLMCSAIMSSRELKLTTLQGTARRQNFPQKSHRHMSLIPIP